MIHCISNLIFFCSRLTEILYQVVNNHFSECNDSHLKPRIKEVRDNDMISSFLGACNFIDGKGFSSLILLPFGLHSFACIKFQFHFICNCLPILMTAKLFSTCAATFKFNMSCPWLFMRVRVFSPVKWQFNSFKCLLGFSACTCPVCCLCSWSFLIPVG